MDNQKNIPNIRFLDFKGEWELKKLGSQFSSRRQKGSKSLPIYSVTQDKGLVPRNSLDRKMGNDAKAEDNLNVESNDLVYNMMRMWQGAIGMAKQNCMVSPAYVVLKPFEKVNPLFFLYFFERSKSIYLFTAYSYGLTSDRLRLYYKDFSGIKFFTPNYSEQTKIASFITAIENKINQLKQKKTLLEQYKKGIMQKIFSQELRFKDENGEEFSKWEKKKLGEVCEKKSSNISANKIEDNFGEYLIYGASGILKKVDFYKEENDYVSIIKDGAGVGRIVYCKGKSSVLGTMEIIKPKIQLNTYLLFCLLENIDFTKYVTGSTIPHIYFKDYKNEYCGIPCFEEQTRIANFLSALDEKINRTQNQIQQTEQYKKGLLQNMFV